MLGNPSAKVNVVPSENSNIHHRSHNQKRIMNIIHEYHNVIK